MRLGRRPAGALVVAVLLALAEEARELGRERVARGELFFRLHQVDAPLELLDVRRRLRVGRDGLRHLLVVLVGGLLELLEIDLGAEQLAETAAKRERRARAWRERDVVGN